MENAQDFNGFSPNSVYQDEGELAKDEFSRIPSPSDTA
jgi:hypothetical protein